MTWDMLAFAGKKYIVKYIVSDTPQVVNCFKVESDATWFPSWINW